MLFLSEQVAGAEDSIRMDDPAVFAACLFMVVWSPPIGPIFPLWGQVLALIAGVAAQIARAMPMAAGMTARAR
jgi:hypothetical protein